MSLLRASRIRTFLTKLLLFVFSLTFSRAWTWESDVKTACICVHIIASYITQCSTEQCWYSSLLSSTLSSVSCSSVHTHTHTQPFNGPLSVTTQVDHTRRNIHPLAPTLIIEHPLSTFSIYCYPAASSLFNLCAWKSFPQPLSRPSLVYLLVWNLLLRTPYISPPNHYLLFATHACLAVI